MKRLMHFLLFHSLTVSSFTTIIRRNCIMVRPPIMTRSSIARRRKHLVVAHQSTSSSSETALADNNNNEKSVSAVTPPPPPRQAKRTKRSVVASDTDTAASSAAANAESSVPSTTTTTTTTRPTTRPVLLQLPQGDDLILGELLQRPSKRNRSPYVGDVVLVEDKKQREALVHLPSLDMGGKCVPGSRLLMKPARDKKGNLVGPNAVNPKYNTPKCEYIAQLLRVEEKGYEPVWIGAHPTLGEKIAEQLISRNLLGPEFPKVESYQREVRNVGGTDNMRVDFVIQHADKKLCQRVLEVKTVVDTDYSSYLGVPENHEKNKCVYVSDEKPYVRTGIFPWGNSKSQKGPDGAPVVSSRAIKHVRELTKLAQQGKQRQKEGIEMYYDTTILFVVIRHDAKRFRPNYEACPSFAKYLKEAHEAGVQILAKQVRWGEEEEGDDVGTCYEGDLLDIVWPSQP